MYNTMTFDILRDFLSQPRSLHFTSRQRDKVCLAISPTRSQNGLISPVLALTSNNTTYLRSTYQWWWIDLLYEYVQYSVPAAISEEQEPSELTLFVLSDLLIKGHRFCCVRNLSPS